jgi:hypothetical protein
MIRPFTLITALMFLGSGAYLFAVKHRAQALDQEIARTVQASRADAARIQVLQAQWALEADPSRLAQLAGQFTSLQPMQPKQLVSLAQLRAELPAAGSVAPVAAPALPVVPVAPVAPDLVARVAPRVTPQRPAPQPGAAARLASVEGEMRHMRAARHVTHARHDAPQFAENRPGHDVSALAAVTLPMPRFQPVSAEPVAAPVSLPVAGGGGSLLGMAQASN